MNEIKQAYQEALKNSETTGGKLAAESYVTLANGWEVRVERIRNMPRGGAMRAWKYAFFLRDPQKNNFGGWDSIEDATRQTRRIISNYSPGKAVLESILQSRGN